MIKNMFGCKKSIAILNKDLVNFSIALYNNAKTDKLKKYSNL